MIRLKYVQADLFPIEFGIHHKGVNLDHYLYVPEIFTVNISKTLNQQWPHLRKKQPYCKV